MVVGLLFYRRARLPQNFFEVENLCVVSYLDDPPTSSFLKGTTRFVVRRGIEPLYRVLPVATTFHRNPTDLVPTWLCRGELKVLSPLLFLSFEFLFIGQETPSVRKKTAVYGNLPNLHSLNIVNLTSQQTSHWTEPEKRRPWSQDRIRTCISFWYRWHSANFYVVSATAMRPLRHLTMFLIFQRTSTKIW